jgi:hypothetical protein
MVAELRVFPAGRLERRVQYEETRDCLIHIRRQAGRVRYAVVADRPDIALESAGQIVSLAERRLRQMTGGDAA